MRPGLQLGRGSGTMGPMSNYSRRGSLGLTLMLAAYAMAPADQFNHKVILVGDRGAALGGAYTGLADDATATWYNPAGLTQLKQLKLNVSAQIVQYQKQRIGIADSKEIPYNSFNFSPSITSLSQKMGNWAYGFSLVTPQNDLYKGAQDLESSYYSNDSTNRCYGDEENMPCTAHLGLSYYELAKNTLFGPSLAYTYNDQLSIGLTLYGIYSSLIEKTSYGSTQSQFLGSNSTLPAKFRDEVVNRDVAQTGLGFSAIFGILVKLADGFSLGVTATPGSYVFVDRDESQRLELFVNNTVFIPGEIVTTGATLYSLDKAESHTEVTAPALSLGCSWSPATFLTLTGQMDYLLGSTYSYTGYSPEVNAGARSDLEQLTPKRFRYQIDKQSVVNLSGGIDMRFNPTYSLTLGGFSDMSQGPFDTRPASWNRRIDWYGVVLSLGMVKQYTESRFGISAAYGDAGISHFRWDYLDGGRPHIDSDSQGNVIRYRQIFNAYNIAVFLSSTLKV